MKQFTENSAIFSLQNVYQVSEVDRIPPLKLTKLFHVTTMVASISQVPQPNYNFNDFNL